MCALVNCMYMLFGVAVVGQIGFAGAGYKRRKFFIVGKIILFYPEAPSRQPLFRSSRAVWCKCSEYVHAQYPG